MAVCEHCGNDYDKSFWAVIKRQDPQFRQCTCAVMCPSRRQDRGPRTGEGRHMLLLRLLRRSGRSEAFTRSDLELFLVDVNRNSKGVPRDAQIKFGCFDSNGEVARGRRDTRRTSGRGRWRLSKTARADGKRRGCSVLAPRPQSVGSSAGRQRGA